MARCQMIRHSWTFCGLVGAFLDLGIAYFLLCCSTIAFFISKFLAFFGLSLPCPCNGLFGYPNHGYCVQRILVDYPPKTVSNLQLAVKSKFPFDAILASRDHCQLNLKLIKERISDDGGLEFDGEVCYSSFSDPRRSQQSLSGSDSIGKFDLKGKGAANQRVRCGSVRRRRRGTIDYGKFSSSSSLDHMRFKNCSIRRSPSVPTKIDNELVLLQPFLSRGRSVSDVESIDATDESKRIYGNTTSFENLKSSVRHVDGIGDEDESAVRILEQALEEEQVARVALCSELEQERIAAASAADEAMSMISRLQEEKAAIEMEARQYQRILEEKSSYDAEEMDILKEIIIMREREKLFLEREVEAYREVIQDYEELEEDQVEDGQGQYEASYLDSSDNPMLILQQLGESIDKRDSIENMRNHSDYASTSVEKELWMESSKDPECPRISPDHLPNMDERLVEVHEKEVLFSETSNSILENDLTLVCEGQNDNLYPCQKLVPDVIETDSVTMLDQVEEPQVHDIHVISPKCDAYKINGKSSDPREQETSFEVLKELEISRTCSDIVNQVPLVGSSPGRGGTSELRRNSLPIVDHERLKIDSEVEWLTARLRAVQDEKEKLKSSLARQERGNAEMQLLEDISKQIREIRHLTEPEKAARQGTLPPLSVKASSKKRRSRSSSIGAGHIQSN